MCKGDLSTELVKLEEARDRFISEIAKNIHLYNITPSAGRLYGTVFFLRRAHDP